MEDVFSLFNHPKDFIDLPVKDFSEVLFFSLKEMAKNCNGKFGTYSLVSHFQSHYKLSHKWEIDCAITQALQELEHSKLIARKLVNGSSASVYENWIITKLGEATESKSDLHEIQQRNRLQVNSLHPDIAEQCYGDYFRGYYESAVFKAYKAVEVSIREKSRLGNDLVGVKLARKAFDPNKGPLTDLSEESGERQAKSDLFAGAIGTFKNPSSHRLVKFDDAAYVAGLLSFASCLLVIIDNCSTP